MRTPRRLIVPALALAALVLGAAGPSRFWDFACDPLGKAPAGFTVEAGTWEVAEDGGNHVLAQRASSDDRVFNVVLADEAQYQDVDLSVRLKAVAGELDRGGGLVWRAKDGKNYYIARFNPLENNLRAYKVVGGVRTMFVNADVTLSEGWHTLRVTMTGMKARCVLDRSATVTFEDATFSDPGRVGLWSKADARTYFDNFTASGPKSKD